LKPFLLLLGLLIILGAGYYLVPARFRPFHQQHATKQSSKTEEKSAPSIVFLNTRPDVKYVGDEVCASCHLSIAESYRHHPMGRSLAPIAAIAREERYGKETRNPFEQFGFQFLVQPRDNKVFHQQLLRDAKGQVVAERVDEVHFVLGSGANGHAYLFDRDGYVFESPISWFSQKQIWDISPGFKELSLSGRPITANCLFCHCNRANSMKDSLNHYQKPIFDGYAIGCERCHGPGELHVQKRERAELVEGMDDTIVNPGRLPPALREAVCQQCHLIASERLLRRGHEHYDYRPGLPLHEFWAIFVAPPRLTENSQAVGQVEQMYSSRCFRASDRQLGCISCHDPHALPPEKEKVSYYRQRCLQCHLERACTAPAVDRQATKPSDNCIHCHMPPYATADIAHTAGTDHRIRKRPDKSLPSQKALRPGETPIVNFYQDLLDPGDPTARRDLGVALADNAAKNGQIGQMIAQLAIPILDEAIRTSPNDVLALEARGRAFWLLDRFEKARLDLDRALAEAPNRETALFLAGLATTSLDDFESAVAYWQRAQMIDPWEPSYHFQLGRLLTKHRDWPKAIQEFQAVLRLNPADPDSHRFLALCWIRSGDPGKARQEIEKAIALTPADAEKLREWFDKLIKESQTKV
jgi:tetratricopeptide (TPR) repeat protein/catechol 2,3-dioxygenase-like lactoylglutathione lyase family enzyme